MADGMKQFVILKHDHPYLHWDFLLERDGVLESWRLLREPLMNEWLAAEPIPDHRIAYLTYEGPVSQNRGVVTRMMSGTYCASAASETMEIQTPERRGLIPVRSLALVFPSEATCEGNSVAAVLARTHDQRWFWHLSPAIAHP